MKQSLYNVTFEGEGKMITLYTESMSVFRKTPEKWKEHIKPSHIDDETIKAIKILLQNCESIAIEYPYYDNEYLSTYYLFYAKKYASFPKESYRIHVFSKEEYVGFFTLRPTAGATKIGKTYLNPSIFLEDEAFVMKNTYYAHILGQEYKIEGIPWMKQDTDISVCGHVAVWVATHVARLGQEAKNNVVMGDLIKAVPQIDTRVIPSNSINTRQMVQTLSEFGFSPMNIHKNFYEYQIETERKPQTFTNELFAYIESHIAPVVCIGNSTHAVTAVGHGKVDYSKLDGEFKDRRIVYFGDLIDSIIVHDDAKQPYLPVKYKRCINAFQAEQDISIENLPSYYIEDFDGMIVPLRERIQYNFASLILRVEDYVDENGLISEGEHYVERVFIVSANELKSYMYKEDVNPLYKKIVLNMNMPFHVWCVDFATFDEYKEKKMSMRFIVDTTACNKDTMPFLLIQTKDGVRVFENGKAEGSYYKAEIESYNIFRGHLEGVEK